MEDLVICALRVFSQKAVDAGLRNRVMTSRRPIHSFKAAVSQKPLQLQQGFCALRNIAPNKAVISCSLRYAASAVFDMHRVQLKSTDQSGKDPLLHFSG
jgi:hypothetical protein